SRGFPSVYSLGFRLVIHRKVRERALILLVQPRSLRREIMDQHTMRRRDGRGFSRRAVGCDAFVVERLEPPVYGIHGVVHSGLRVPEPDRIGGRTFAPRGPRR